RFMKAAANGPNRPNNRMRSAKAEEICASLQPNSRSSGTIITPGVPIAAAVTNSVRKVTAIIDVGRHISCQVVPFGCIAEVRNEGDPGTSRCKPRAHHRSCGRVVPQQGLLRYWRRRPHEGGRADAWRVLWPFCLEGRSDCAGKPPLHAALGT